MLGYKAEHKHVLKHCNQQKSILYITTILVIIVNVRIEQQTDEQIGELDEHLKDICGASLTR